MSEHSMNIYLKYLIILPSGFTEKKHLINFLQSRSSFEIKQKSAEDTIVCTVKNKEFERKISIASIDTHNDAKKKHFLVSLTFDANKLQDIKEAETFKREINTVVANTKDLELVLLNDGISKYYSTKAYAILHDVETALRAFITELMVFYGNHNWITEAIEILNIKDKQQELKILYNRNFDQLREFLFTDYSDFTYKELVDDIVKASDPQKAELVEGLKHRIPRTNWKRLVEKAANKNSISEEEFTKLLEKVYELRNKIAHCNDFIKDDYERFEGNCKRLREYTEILTKIIEENKLNDTDDQAIVEDLSAIFSPLETFDTIIVPANESGFSEVFLRNNQWYSVAIYNERIKYLKYIAAYIKNPSMQITHYAEISHIEASPYDERKKIIYFNGSASELDSPIQLGRDKAAFQRSRYTTFERLIKAKTTDDLFDSGDNQQS